MATAKGHLDIVEWFWENNKSVPTIHQLVFQGLFKTADWLHSKSDGKYPDQNAINEAIEQGRCHVLKWISGKNARIFPKEQHILRAILHGYEGSLFWILKNSPKRLFSPTIFDSLASSGHWAFIENMLGLNIIWKPSQSNVDIVVRSGRVTTLVKLLKIPQLLRPSNDSINAVARFGHVESLHLIHEHFSDALPDARTIAALYTSGQLEVIRFLYAVVPNFKTTRVEMNAAANNGHVKVLEYCHSRNLGLLPKKHIATTTDHVHVRIWYKRAKASMGASRTRRRAKTEAEPIQKEQPSSTQLQHDNPSFGELNSDDKAVSAIVAKDVGLQRVQRKNTLSSIKCGQEPLPEVTLTEQPFTSSTEVPNLNQDALNRWQKRLTEIEGCTFVSPPLPVHPEAPVVLGSQLFGYNPTATNAGHLQPRSGPVASLGNFINNQRVPTTIPPTQTRVYSANRLPGQSGSNTKVPPMTPPPTKIDLATQLQGRQFSVPKIAYESPMATSPYVHIPDSRNGAERTEHQPSSRPAKRQRLESSSQQSSPTAFYHDSS
ncbi:Ankyrin repeat [Paramicrosporidium saccamoebae]|uniref:Ankyrin repeat n=1 Tax=Paramicrosporidium saccamoebae TaxID=1246581 RepID=A0A2H9TG87_9FUNG|nr:Ankyrin repeat [Paramicrosporidium saccamoebae]